MDLFIPKNPDGLTLKLNKLWNGQDCQDDRLFVEVTMARKKEGLDIAVVSPMLHEQKIPEAPIGTRVDGLWDYDVVELFIVGPGHRYVELELGAGGHWLLLEFDRIRHRNREYKEFDPLLKYEHTAEKMWKSQLVLPWNLITENVRAMNVFGILAGQFLALSPVPGSEPDFHQPDCFPLVRSFDVV